MELLSNYSLKEINCYKDYHMMLKLMLAISVDGFLSMKTQDVILTEQNLMLKLILLLKQPSARHHTLQFIF